MTKAQIIRRDKRRGLTHEEIVLWVNALWEAHGWFKDGPFLTTMPWHEWMRDLWWMLDHPRSTVCRRITSDKTL